MWHTYLHSCSILLAETDGCEALTLDWKGERGWKCSRACPNMQVSGAVGGG